MSSLLETDLLICDGSRIMPERLQNRRDNGDECTKGKSALWVNSLLNSYLQAPVSGPSSFFYLKNVVLFLKLVMKVALLTYQICISH